MSESMFGCSELHAPHCCPHFVVHGSTTPCRLLVLVSPCIYLWKQVEDSDLKPPFVYSGIGQ